MANLKKMTRAGTGHMMKHYERGKDENGEYVKYKNSSIDLERTKDNYNLTDMENMTQQERLEKRLSEVKVLNRKNVNVTCTWVVTAPKDMAPERQREFFEKVHDFLANRYGAENEISSYVHMDETTPHMHYCFVPVTQDKKKGIDKVSAKEVCDMDDLKTFHTDLQKELDEAMGQDTARVLNGATANGNMTIDELKAKTLQEEVAKLEKEVAENEKKLSESQEKLTEAQDKLFETQQETHRSEQIKRKNEMDIARQELDKGILEDDIATSKKELNKSQEKLTEAQEELKKANNELVEIKSEVKEARKELDETKTEKDQERKEFNFEKREHEGQIDKLKTERNKLSTERDYYRSEVNQLIDKKKDQDKKIASGLEKLASLKGDIGQAEAERDGVQKEIDEKKAQLLSLGKDLARVSGQIKDKAQEAYENFMEKVGEALEKAFSKQGKESKAEAMSGLKQDTESLKLKNDGMGDIAKGVRNEALDTAVKAIETFMEQFDESKRNNKRGGR